MRTEYLRLTGVVLSVYSWRSHWCLMSICLLDCGAWCVCGLEQVWSLQYGTQEISTEHPMC